LAKQLQENGWGKDWENRLQATIAEHVRQFGTTPLAGMRKTIAGTDATA